MKNKFYFLNKQKKEKVTKELKELISLVVSKTLESENVEYGCEVSVMFTDNEKIREINKETRNIDKATDVLSFPIISDDDEIGDFNPETNLLMIGDIVLSLEKARKQSLLYGHSFEREVAFLSVHSTLHLLGYDHETSKEDEIYMNEKQESILNELGIKRD